MQGENQTFLDFSDRTDALAVRLGCDVQDLPERLGFSRSSLFAYRTGKSRISPKAWAKLEMAERAAGLDEVEKNPAESENLREDSAGYRYRAATPPETALMIGRIEKRLDDLTDLVREIAEVLEIRRKGPR